MKFGLIRKAHRSGHREGQIERVGGRHGQAGAARGRQLFLDAGQLRGRGRIRVVRLAAEVAVDSELAHQRGDPAQAALVSLGIDARAFLSDGATLQTGIGGVPDLIAHMLADGPGGDYGIHSEMFTDGLMALQRAGKVSNRKGLHDGLSIATFAMGSHALYEWLDHNEPLKAKHVMSRLQAMRGGRDNDARFGVRQRGEGEYAQLLAQRFAAACARLGLNQRERFSHTMTLFRPPVLGPEQLSLL